MSSQIVLLNHLIRFMELLLSSIAIDDTNSHIKGVWAHVGGHHVDHDFIGFLIHKCSFEQQIEKIQIIRQQLQLTTHEKIYFRSHRNFIENHEWLPFRASMACEDTDRLEMQSNESFGDPFVRLDTRTRVGHKKSINKENLVC